MNEGQWLTSLFQCYECAHEWVAVHPVEAEYLECPSCHHMSPAPAVPDAELEDFQE